MFLKELNTWWGEEKMQDLDILASDSKETHDGLFQGISKLGVNDTQAQQKDPQDEKVDTGNAPGYRGFGRGLSNYDIKQTVSPTGKHNKEVLTHASRYSIPYFTYIILIVNIILLIWPLAMEKNIIKFTKNPLMGPSPNALFDMGAKWFPSIIYGGQWWRLFSPMFLHSGLLHLGFNCLSFYSISKDLEVIHGTFRLAPIYILSGFGGNCFSACFLPRFLSVGASSSIFGFNALLLVDLINSWKHLKYPHRSLSMLIAAMAISFAMGFMPQIDNFAHIGGFLTGMLAGFVFLPSMRFGTFSIRMRFVQFFIALPLLLFIVLFFPIYFAIWKKPIECSWCRYMSCAPIWDSCRE